jgi:uncharacterized protein (DUF433 family)
MATITSNLSQPTRTQQDQELVSRGVFSPWISINPARMHGAPCFKDTRVPIQTLFDHLRAGDSLAMFLEGFPDVTREQAVAVIDLAATGLLEGLRHP